MLYTVANLSWTPGEPLTPSMARCGLSRWRPKSEDVAAGCPILAIALRYDQTRGQVVADGATARGRHGPWSAPAIVDSGGGVMVLAPIPAALVRVIGAAEIRVHPDSARAHPRTHLRSRHPVASPARVRTVDGRAVVPKKPRPTTCGKAAASHPEPARTAGGSHRIPGIARLGIRDAVRDGTGTPSALRGEHEAHPGARPPPKLVRGGLRSLVVPLVLKWKEDELS